jgi:hypothetical protein
MCFSGCGGGGVMPRQLPMEAAPVWPGGRCSASVREMVQHRKACTNGRQGRQPMIKHGAALLDMVRSRNHNDAGHTCEQNTGSKDWVKKALTGGPVRENCASQVGRNGTCGPDGSGIK